MQKLQGFEEHLTRSAVRNMPVSVTRYSPITRSHAGIHMYHHVKKLMYTVCVDEPDPRFGNMLLEQFEGANGELAAAMQYSVQGINCEDPARKDLLMDNGAAVDVRRENAGRCRIALN